MLLRRGVGAGTIVAALVPACPAGSSPAAAPPKTAALATAGFSVQPGVNIVTVTGTKPQTELTLVDKTDQRLITLVSDDKGQASFSLVPSTPIRFETGK